MHKSVLGISWTVGSLVFLSFAIFAEEASDSLRANFTLVSPIFVLRFCGRHTLCDETVQIKSDR